MPSDLDGFIAHCRDKWREVLTFRDQALLDEFMRWLTEEGQEMLRECKADLEQAPPEDARDDKGQGVVG